MKIRIGFWVIVVICFLDNVYSLDVTHEGAIQYRLKSSAFNKYVNALFSSKAIIQFLHHNHVNGTVEDTQYSLKRWNIKEAELDTQEVTLPCNDCIEVNANYVHVVVVGDITLLKNNERLSLKNVEFKLLDVLLSTDGEIEYENRVISSTSTSERKCTVDYGDLVHLGDHNEEDKLGEFISMHGLRNIFGNSLCKIQRARLTLQHSDFWIHRKTPKRYNKYRHFNKTSSGYKKKKGRLNWNLPEADIKFHKGDMKIHDKTVIITNTVKSVWRNKTNATDIGVEDASPDLLPKYPRYPTFPVRSTSSPVELWFNDHVFNKMLSDMSDHLWIGKEKISLSELFPVFKYKDIESYKAEGIFPKIGEVFPDSLVNFLVEEADMYFNITSKALQVHFNVTGEVTATLKCDPGRTYTAFKFTMEAYVPVQMVYDNVKFTLRYLGFGGKFTVLESNIGHISDRWLSAMFYIAPQHCRGHKPFYDEYHVDDNKNAHQYKKNNYSDIRHGGTFKLLLPTGLFLKHPKIELTEGYIIMGGHISTTDPKGPLIEPHVVGEHEPLDDLAFPLYDTTPDDLEPWQEQNCKPPPPPMPLYSHGNIAAAMTGYPMLMLILKIAVTLICL